MNDQTVSKTQTAVKPRPPHLQNSNCVLAALASENSNMSTLDRLVNLYWSLLSVLRAEVPGEIVELGCNAGRTSVALGMIIEKFDASRGIHVFDSFQGLPTPGTFDRYLREGECLASEAELLGVFRSWGVSPPVVRSGWFSDTLEAHLPEQIAFAYLDNDFYDSVLLSLTAVWPRLSIGGTVIIDDYADSSLNERAWQGLPGVKKACDDFFQDIDAERTVLIGNGDLAFVEFRKRGPV